MVCGACLPGAMQQTAWLQCSWEAAVAAGHAHTLGPPRSLLSPPARSAGHAVQPTAAARPRADQHLHDERAGCPAGLARLGLAGQRARRGAPGGCVGRGGLVGVACAAAQAGCGRGWGWQRAGRVGEAGRAVRVQSAQAAQGTRAEPAAQHARELQSSRRARCAATLHFSHHARLVSVRKSVTLPCPPCRPTLLCVTQAW